MQMLPPPDDRTVTLGRDCRAGRQGFSCNDLCVDQVVIRRQSLRNSEIGIPRIKAWTQNDLSTKSRDRRFQVVTQRHEARHQHQLVLRQVLGVRWQDVDRQTGPTQRRIGREHQIEVVEILSLRLNLPCPLRDIIKDDRHVCLGGAGLRHRFDVPRDLFHFVQCGGVAIVGTQKGGVHLFLRKRRLSPAKVADDLRTMRKSLPTPEPDHAGQGSRVPGGPVDRAGLLLHHPPASLTDSAIKVVMEGLKVGMSLAHVSRAGLCIAIDAVHQKAQRVAVPAGDIEVGAHGKVVKFKNPTHVIMQERRICPFSQGSCHDGIEPDDLIRCKAAKGQHMCWVGFGYRHIRKVDFVEFGIIHRPEHVTPCAVQCVRGLVFLSQPAAKAGLCRH